MNSSKFHLHKRLSTFGIAAGLIAFGCISARADSTSTQTVTESPSGSYDNVTNSDVLTVFSVSPTFTKFNTSLGTLDSATLTWSAGGSLTVSGNMEGQAIMSYQTSSDTETWNIYGGTYTVSFTISGTEELALAGAEGSGTFSPGPFAETFQLQEGYFPAGYAASATSGTFTLTYDYTPAGAPAPPPPPAVPEISSVSYLFTITSMLGGAFVLARRARARASAN